MPLYIRLSKLNPVNSHISLLGQKSAILCLSCAFWRSNLGSWSISRHCLVDVRVSLVLGKKEKGEIMKMDRKAILVILLMTLVKERTGQFGERNHGITLIIKVDDVVVCQYTVIYKLRFKYCVTLTPPPLSLVHHHHIIQLDQTVMRMMFYAQ